MEGLSMESLYRRVGTEEQVYGVRRLILDEGTPGARRCTR